MTLLLRKVFRSQRQGKIAEKNSQEFVIATRDATDESQGMVNKGAIMSTYEQSRYNCCGSDYAASKGKFRLANKGFKTWH